MLAKTKILILTIIPAILLIVAVELFYKNNISPKLIKLDLIDNQKNIDRAVEEIILEIDEMKSALGKFKAKYLAKNDDFTITNKFYSENRINLIYVINNKFTKEWCKVIDSNTKYEIKLPGFIELITEGNIELLKIENDNENIPGIIVTEGGPVLLIFNPIVDKNKKNVGTIVVGKFITADLISRLIRKTSSDIEIWPNGIKSMPLRQEKILWEIENEDKETINVINRSFITSYTGIRDISGKTKILLSSTTSREISNVINYRYHFYIIGCIAITAILQVIAINYYINRSYGASIAALTQYFKDISNNMKNYVKQPNNINQEFQILANSIKKTMNKIHNQNENIKNKTENNCAHIIYSRMLQHTQTTIQPLQNEANDLKNSIKTLPFSELIRIASELPVCSQEKKVKLAEEIETLTGHYKESQYKIYNRICSLSDSIDQLQNKIESFDFRRSNKNKDS